VLCIGFIFNADIQWVGRENAHSPQIMTILLTVNLQTQ